MTANRQVDKLAELCKLHRPDYACVADASLVPRLHERLAGAGLDCRILAGEAGLVEVASLPGVDCVMAAIVGAAGPPPPPPPPAAGKETLPPDQGDARGWGPPVRVHGAGARGR